LEEKNLPPIFFNTPLNDLKQLSVQTGHINSELEVALNYMWDNKMTVVKNRKNGQFN
jgi:hypothetical protein